MGITNRFNIYPEGYSIFLIKNDSRQNISNLLTDHTSAEKRTNKKVGSVAKSVALPIILLVALMFLF
ncbi:hypothetical protein DWX11_08905 [Ruminococcus sp. AF18-29]|nr:hypothetical protein DWX11_08905 [Ruminococcus sp. AF18-29]